MLLVVRELPAGEMHDRVHGPIRFVRTVLLVGQLGETRLRLVVQQPAQRHFELLLRPQLPGRLIDGHQQQIIPDPMPVPLTAC